MYSLLGLIKGAAQIPIDYTITLHELQERLKGTIAIAQDIPRALVPTGFAANPCVYLSSLMPSSINGRFRHVPTTMLKSIRRTKRLLIKAATNIEEIIPCPEPMEDVVSCALPTSTKFEVGSDEALPPKGDVHRDESQQYSALTLQRKTVHECPDCTLTRPTRGAMQ